LVGAIKGDYLDGGKADYYEKEEGGDETSFELLTRADS
jgi:hypothetical protein